MSESMIERVAKAIYDAPTRFDGDSISTHLGRSEMVDSSVRTAAEEREVVMDMCRDAAKAAIAAVRASIDAALNPPSQGAEQ